MKGLLLKEWYTFRLLFLTGIAAAVILPPFFTSKSFYFYYALAIAIGLYPLLSAGADERSRFDAYVRTMPQKASACADLYYLVTALLTGILLLSVCCIPEETRLGFFRSIYTNRIHFSRVTMPEGEFAFMTLMTKPQMIWTMGTAALLMPAVYLPVLLRFGQRAGACAVFLSLTLCLMYLIYYRGAALSGSYLMQDELLYLAAALGTALLFLISHRISAAVCKRQAAA